MVIGLQFDRHNKYLKLFAIYHKHLIYILPFYLFLWSLTGSNRGPTDYESVALTYWAKGPKMLEEHHVSMDVIPRIFDWSRISHIVDFFYLRFLDLNVGVGHDNINYTLNTYIPIFTRYVRFELWYNFEVIE